jgi:8-oxo-dGTP diphosphatase
MGLSVQVSGYRNAAGAFVMKGKKFLILQRSTKETSMHGLWELPGGKVEEGETPRQTAVIEVKEEAGLDIKLKSNLGPHHDDKKKKTYHAYIATAKKGQKVKLSEEHSAHKWVTPEEVMAMPKEMVSHHLLYLFKKEGETI